MSAAACDLVHLDLVHLDWREGAAWLTLDRPGRGNALVPELLAALRARIAEARQAGAGALVLTGRGRAFSAGGDVARFAALADDRDALVDWSREIVGALNAAILDLLAFPMPVIAALNGPVTGGSAGLMLAADMVVMSEDAFLQPYYAQMGFAPDGGWTALLPARIGTARALEVQYLNQRLTAADCLRLGLASETCPPAELEALVRVRLSTLAGMDPGTLAMTRANVWSEEHLAAVAKALQRELDGFLALIARPQTRERMRTFLAPLAAGEVRR